MGRVRTYLFALVACGALTLALASAGASATTSPLDPTFGTAGRVTVTIPDQSVYGVGGTVQDDGKAIVVGDASTSNGDHYDAFVARLNTDGSVDSSFGSGGEVLTDVAGNKWNDVAETATVMPNGQILVGGLTHPSDSDLYYTNFVERLNPDGTLDTSFGTGGYFTAQWSDYKQAVSAIAVQDGKIIVVSSTFDAYGFDVARLNADGTLDTTFGSGGRVHDSSYSFGYSVAVQPDGAIVVGGMGPTGAMQVWRYTADGAADPSFGNGAGYVTGPAPAKGSIDLSWALVLQPDGKIVVAGGRGATGYLASNEALALERFTADGHIDTTFGAKGVASVQVGRHDDEAEALLQAPDGKLVALGFTNTTQAAGSVVSAVAAARFTPEGKLDTGFAGKGFTSVAGVWANGGAMLPDGRFYAFGGGGGATALRFLAGTPTVSVSPLKAAIGDVVHVLTPGVDASASVKIGSLQVPSDNVSLAHTGQLDVVVPPGAVTGKVMVTTSDWTRTSATPLGIVPGLTGLSTTDPLLVAAKLGITGTSFVGVKSVSVAGVKWAAKVDSPTHITATVPAAALPGPVVVTNAAGPSRPFGAVTLAPTVASFAPASALAGASVTVKGTGLSGAEVTIGGTPATVTKSAAQSLTFTVPNVAPVAQISAQVGDGPAALSKTSFKPLPKLTSVDPATAGTSTVLRGTNLVGLSAVQYNGTSVSFTPLDGLSAGTAVQAALPANATSGKWTVTTAAGSATLAGYTPSPAPQITSFAPNDGVQAARIVVSGTGLGRMATATFDAGQPDAVTVPVISATPTSVVLRVPQDAASGPIELSGPDGTATSPTSFTVDLSAVIVSPVLIPGDTVTLSGHNLDTVTSVTLGDTYYISGVIQSKTATSLVIAVPPGLPSSGSITIYAPAGSVKVGSYTTPSPLPQASASQSGDQLAVAGTHLSTITEVDFPDGAGGWVASTTVQDVTTGTEHLEVTIPAGARSGQLKLVDGQGVSMWGGWAYSIIAVASLSEPTWLPGDTVTITGSGLTHATIQLAGETCSVSDGGTDASLTFTVPADATDGDLVITTSFGTYDAGAFDQTVTPVSADRVAQGAR